MALFGSGGHGLSLKALLEDPNLQNPSKLNSGLPDLKKGGNHHGTYVSNANSAFLGPNLWEKQGDNSNDLDLEYMDLDEFLSENGIPVSTEDANDMQTISLLANALTNSPAHSPNSGIPIRINPSSPDSRSSLLSPKAESPHGINLGVFMPESPIRRSVSPLSYQTGSPPSSQSAIERCLLDDTFGVKLDLPEEESPSWETAESPAATEVDFEVNESDLALVTIPVIRQERSEGMVYSNEQCEQWDSDNSNDFDENMIQNNIPGQDNFDPKRRRFTEEELKPQPIIKKSKKVFVDEGKKDDRYWTRRNKNNVAAKRSRDARRVKENQIAMRASFLEAENEKLKKEFQRVQKDNEKLITRLSKYETV